MQSPDAVRFQCSDIFVLQTNSITAISILDGGSGYVPGDLKIYPDSGSGFFASFSVDAQNGSVRFAPI